MKIEVRLSTKIFRRFSFFDTFRRRKAWRGPLIFFLIMAVFGGICFWLHERQGAVMLGCLLMGIGILLPAAYVLNFLLSVNKQAADQGLAGVKHVYTLEMDPDSKMFTVDNGKQKLNLKWKDVHCIYRDTVAAYLFVSPRQAFLLPYSCMDNPADTFWPLVKSKLPAEKITDLR